MSKVIRKNLLKTLVIALTVVSVSGSSLMQSANAAGSYWKKVDSEWYYIDSNGKNTTGWFVDDGNWYYCWSNGMMAHDTWLESSGKWYYLGSSGAMATNTTIGEYRVGSDGAWIIDSRGNLEWEDIHGEHFIRNISSREKDINAGNSISSCNIDLSFKDNKRNLEDLSVNLAQGKKYLSEAKEKCIGKTIAQKYKIIDIKMFNEIFKDTQGIEPEERINTIRQSKLATYKSNSSYVFDKYLIFNRTNNNSSEWECTRVVIEFEEV